jgi:hypothetical protein
MKCKELRKNHRYYATNYEIIMGLRNNRRYNFCLECGFNPLKSGRNKEYKITWENGKSDILDYETLMLLNLRGRNKIIIEEIKQEQEK